MFKFLPLDGFMSQKTLLLLLLLLLLLFTVTAVITPNFTLEAPHNSAPAAAPTLPPTSLKISFLQPVPVHPHAVCSSQRERPNLTYIKNRIGGAHGGAVG